MKVFALGLFAKPLTDEQRKRILPKEVPDTLRLYLDGKIDQFWFREDKPGGVVFLMNSTSVEEAKSTPSRIVCDEPNHPPARPRRRLSARQRRAQRLRQRHRPAMDGRVPLRPAAPPHRGDRRGPGRRDGFRRPPRPPRQGPQLWISEVAVAPPYQGQGIGRRL